MYDEEWMVKAGAWAGLGVFLTIGGFLTIIVTAYFLWKYLGG